ncbi:hypothetical protein JL720_14015 [Aureococcus anophagefferens]|nr:hypothetical protein JL720_14015 [Aureococcus anophagefferens]
MEQDEADDAEVAAISARASLDDEPKAARVAMPVARPPPEEKQESRGALHLSDNAAAAIAAAELRKHEELAPAHEKKVKAKRRADEAKRRSGDRDRDRRRRRRRTTRPRRAPPRRAGPRSSTPRPRATRGRPRRTTRAPAGPPTRRGGDAGSGEAAEKAAGGKKRRGSVARRQSADSKGGRRKSMSMDSKGSDKKAAPAGGPKAGGARRKSVVGRRKSLRKSLKDMQADGSMKKLIQHHSLRSGELAKFQQHRSADLKGTEVRFVRLPDPTRNLPFAIKVVSIPKAQFPKFDKLRETAVEAFGHDVKLFRPADRDDGDDPWLPIIRLIQQKQRSAAPETDPGAPRGPAAAAPPPFEPPKNTEVDDDLGWYACLKAWDERTRARHVLKATEFSDKYAETVGCYGSVHVPDAEIVKCLDATWEFAHQVDNLPGVTDKLLRKLAVLAKVYVSDDVLVAGIRAAWKLLELRTPSKIAERLVEMGLATSLLTLLRRGLPDAARDGGTVAARERWNSIVARPAASKAGAGDGKARRASVSGASESGSAVAERGAAPWKMVSAVAADGEARAAPTREKHGLSGHRVRLETDRDVSCDVAYLSVAVLVCLARQHQIAAARDALSSEDGLEILEAAAVAYEDDVALQQLALGGLWFVLSPSRNARRAFSRRCGLWGLAALARSRDVRTNCYAIAVSLLLVADREVTGELGGGDRRAGSPASFASRRSPSPTGATGARVPPPAGLTTMLANVVGLARWCARHCLDDGAGDGIDHGDDAHSRATTCATTHPSSSSSSSSSSESDGDKSYDSDAPGLLRTKRRSREAPTACVDVVEATAADVSDLGMDVLGVELIDAAEKARADATRRETYYGLKDGKGDVPRRDRVKALHLASNAAHAILELRATSGYEVDTLLKGDELEDLVQALYDCRGRSKTKEFDGAIRSATAALYR